MWQFDYILQGWSELEKLLQSFSSALFRHSQHQRWCSNRTTGSGAVAAIGWITGLNVCLNVFLQMRFFKLLKSLMQIYSVLSYNQLLLKFLRLHWLHKPLRSSCTSWAPLPGPPSNQICLPTTCSPTCRPWRKTGL